MAWALKLAEKGLWTTDPNPRVGCVLVRDGEVVGTGWHRAAGESHAEVLALEDAGESASGATAYVTLEPCSHTGRTAPCADALIAAGVAEVVAAMADPHERVAGSGFAKLEAAGIRVRTGLLEAAARELNIGFVSRHERGRPWVRVKLAASLDGRTAGADRASQWITGEAARADGHCWRARAGAILTGIGTVEADDPQLTVRVPGAVRQPAVVVLNSRGRLSEDAHIFEEDRSVFAAVCGDSPAPKKACRLQFSPAADGRVPLPELMTALAEREINELHVEAGPTLSGALLAAGLADELLVYLAPSLIGADGAPLVRLPGVEKLDQRLHLEWLDMRRVGDDLRLRLRPAAKADMR